MALKKSKKQDPAEPISPRNISLALLALDLFGLLFFFNLAHWYFLGIVPDNFLLSRKLLILIFTTCAIFYILDLYTLQSKVTELATIARNVLGIGIVGWLMAILIYFSGPKYMGGLLGRGVFSWGLFWFFVWTVAWRYFLVRWFKKRKQKILWLVIIDQKTLPFFWEDFFSDIQDESLIFLIDSPPDTLPSKLEKRPEIVGGWEDLQKFAETSALSGVIVATKSLNDKLLLELSKIRLQGIKVYDLNDYCENFLGKVPIFYLQDSWLALSHGFDLLHNVTGWRLKRLSDIVLSSLFMLIALPFMVLFYVLIRIESRGPGLFKQERIGHNARRFVLYKFRTMYENSADKDIYTQKEDARVTRFGKILRRLRMGEIPQLFNVIKGDMSLIGPRAEWIECVKNYENVIPFYHYRHIIKPGITGWAQVLYPYGTSVEDARIKLQYDLYYIKNYSIILDMIIILKTIRVIVFGQGQ